MPRRFINASLPISIDKLPRWGICTGFNTGARSRKDEIVNLCGFALKILDIGQVKNKGDGIGLICFLDFLRLAH